jgi:hypothetical protein
VVDDEIGAEERLITAATARVSDDHDTDRLVAERAIPEGGAGEDQRGDLPPVEGERQRIPATAGAVIAWGVGRRWPRLRGRPR